MRWACKHVKWTQNQWDIVIFSDESSFTVRPTALRKRVWREANTRYHLNNLVPTFKSDFVSLPVWAAFSIRRRTPLIRIQGTLKQDQYKEILSNNLFPFASRYHESLNNILFQQDNCGPHKAKTVVSYLDASNIELMDWPAQSADLNLIKNVWAYLKQKLRNRNTHPSNSDELYEILQNEWASIPTSYFQSLMYSMPARAYTVTTNRVR